MSSSPARRPTESTPESQARKPALYSSPNEALQEVRKDFLYWTEKLTDSSFELSLAVIAANWAAFGSVEKILNNAWAKVSLLLVIACLALSLCGARLMGELHRERIDYAVEDRDRWVKEYAGAGGPVPWPFTKRIVSLGKALRFVKSWLPLLAGASFLVALFTA